MYVIYNMSHIHYLLNEPKIVKISLHLRPEEVLVDPIYKNMFKKKFSLIYKKKTFFWSRIYPILLFSLIWC